MGVLVKLALPLKMALVAVCYSYNPSDLRAPFSITGLMTVDVATLPADERRDDDEEVAYCPYRLISLRHRSSGDELCHQHPLSGRTQSRNCLYCWTDKIVCGKGIFTIALHLLGRYGHEWWISKHVERSNTDLFEIHISEEKNKKKDYSEEFTFGSIIDTRDYRIRNWETDCSIAN
jgi:hypothetical protein